MQIIIGKNPLVELIKSGRRRVHEVWLATQKGLPSDPELEEILRVKRVPCRLVDKRQIEAMMQKENLSGHSQGVLARVDDFPYLDLTSWLAQASKQSTVMVFDSIQDPHNFGALCRSAHCFGVDAVIFNKDASAEVNATVCKTSAGAVEYLNLIRVTNLARSLDELKENGFWCYGSDGQARETLSTIQFAEKSALVLGSEGSGMRRLVREKCDLMFKIPMVGTFDSLNVSQAGTIIAYEMAKKRAKV